MVRSMYRVCASAIIRKSAVGGSDLEAAAAGAVKTSATLGKVVHRIGGKGQFFADRTSAVTRQDTRGVSKLRPLGESGAGVGACAVPGGVAGCGVDEGHTGARNMRRRRLDSGRKLIVSVVAEVSCSRHEISGAFGVASHRITLDVCDPRVSRALELMGEPRRRMKSRGIHGEVRHSQPMNTRLIIVKKAQLLLTVPGASGD